jgi:hypothetical protein
MGGVGASTNHTRHTREGGYPVRRGFSVIIDFSGILDHPLEPVIGLAEGETRWRVMTRVKLHAGRHHKITKRARKHRFQALSIYQ